MRYLPSARVADAGKIRDVIAAWRSFEARFGYSPWAVTLRDTGELVGDAGLMPYDGRGPQVEILGHLMLRRVTRALILELAVAVLDYAFQDLALADVVAAVADDHITSRRLLGQLGFADTSWREHGLRLYSLSTAQWSGVKGRVVRRSKSCPVAGNDG